jgi:hypothetical protein
MFRENDGEAMLKSHVEQGQPVPARGVQKLKPRLDKMSIATSRPHEEQPDLCRMKQSAKSHYIRSIRSRIP